MSHEFKKDKYGIIELLLFNCHWKMAEPEIQKDEDGGSGTNFKFRTLDLK